MTTKRIPTREWQTTLDSLSRTYRGALVSVEIMSRRVGDQPQVRKVPLGGITSDSSGITIETSRRPAEHLGHRIERPRAVWIHEREDGAVTALEVQATDGTGTLLTFQSPMRPEMLDAAVE
jgi:hypothetical protein